jgi:enamine deaminase RidA (YjgF/YER057c/UK114 family)
VTITLKSPSALPAVPIYQQVSIATGSRLVFVAGQVARDAAGTRIGEGDLAAQTEQCYVNIAAALAEAGAAFDDVAKYTVYLVDWTPEKMGAFVEGAERAARRLGLETLSGPPLTGIGVAALAEPDLLIEIEATAVVGG